MSEIKIMRAILHHRLYALKAVIVNLAEFNPQLMTAWMSKN
jgi:hypothetical protein